MNETDREEQTLPEGVSTTGSESFRLVTCGAYQARHVRAAGSEGLARRVNTFLRGYR